jgi:hemerythrin-like domain-containing protein
MKITQVLLGEHGAMYPLLDLIERATPEASLEAVKLQAAFLQSTLISHAGIEDVLLRPAIQEHLPAPAPNPDGTPGPTDHEVIDAGLRAVLAANDAEGARALLLDTVAKTRKHFHKEEKLIFGIADRELSAEDQERLGAEWAARRNAFVA